LNNVFDVQNYLGLIIKPQVFMVQQQLS